MAKTKKKTFPRKFKNQQDGSSAPADDTVLEEEEDDDDRFLATTSTTATDQKLSSSRVIMVGMGLVGIGMLGFYYIPGLMMAVNDDDNEKEGDRWVDAFYCSAITLTT